MNQITNISKSISLLFILSLFFSSCLEELSKTDKIKIDTSPNVALPLVTSDFTIEDFLTDGQSNGLISENNGLLVLTYRSELFSQSASSLFSVSNQQSPTLSVSGSSFTLPPGGTVTITQSQTFAITSSQSLDSILLKAGQMTININSTIAAMVDLTFTIPSLKKNGVVFKQVFTFSNNATLSPAFDVAGYSLDLTNNNTTTNTISFGITAILTSTGQTVSSTSSLDVDFTLSNPTFKGLFGQLGTQSYQVPPSSVNIDIFNNVSAGSFQLQDPQLTLNVDNSFGFQATADISQIKASKSTGSLALTGTAASSPANPYTLAAPTQVGRSAKTSILLNSSNSNISQFVSFLPTQLSYALSGQLNPGNATHSFALDTSRISVEADCVLPFYGQLKGLALSKKYDFGGINTSDFQSGTIQLKTENELPFDAYLQVYFLSSTNVVLDSVFVHNKPLINAAPVDANGITTASTQVFDQAPVDQAKLDRIKNATSILVSTVISTSNNGTIPIKVMSGNRLKIDLGASFQIQLK